ncbi:hypothetical protein NL676_018762 [Syzygium grande]|nr:hypothetical protein NL676_018762 [Syzygium grande]
MVDSWRLLQCWRTERYMRDHKIASSARRGFKGGRWRIWIFGFTNGEFLPPKKNGQITIAFITSSSSLLRRNAFPHLAGDIREAPNLFVASSSSSSRHANCSALLNSGIVIVLSNFAPSSMAFVMFVEWYLVHSGARNRWPFVFAIANLVLFDLSVSKNNVIADGEGTHHLAISIICFVLAMLCGSVELRFGNLELVSTLFAASVDVERWLF